MSNRAPLTIDGVLVGYISLSFSEEIPVGMGLPPSVGLGAQPYSPGAAAALSGTPAPRRLGGDHGSGSGHSRQHHAPEKHGPTFRPGQTPRGSAPPAKPHTTTLEEVNKAVAGGPGLKSRRARFEQELKDKPWLREKLIHIASGENDVTREANQAVTRVP
jgi:hypothetical protein